MAVKKEAKEVYIINSSDSENATSWINRYLESGWKRSGPMIVTPVTGKNYPVLFTQTMRR